MTTSKWTLALNRCQEHRCQVHLTSALYTLSTCPRGPNLVHITPRRVVFEKQSCWKSESTERPSTWNWILNCQLVCTLSTYPRGPKFDRFHSTSSHFRGTRLSKIGRNIGNAQHISLTSNWLWTLCCPQKSRSPQTDFEHSVAPKVPCILSTCTTDPHFGQFCCMTSHFEDIAHLIIPID